MASELKTLLEQLTKTCKEPMLVFNDKKSFELASPSFETSDFFKASLAAIEIKIKDVDVNELNGDFLLETEFSGHQALLKFKWYVSKMSSKDESYLVFRVDSSASFQKNVDIFENEISQQKKALDEAAIVAITDTRGVINYVNKKFVELSEYSNEELIGNTHAILNSHHHPKEFFADMWKTIAQGKIWRGDVKNRAKSGSCYWVDTTIVPMLDVNKKPISYVAIRYEITEKVEAKEAIALERARTSYAEKMASLGELAAGIAHELGNPLASINAWLDVLISSIERGSLEIEKFQKTAQGVKQKTERMAKILKGMLSYARDGSNDPKTTINVSSLIKDVIDYTHHKLVKSSVVISSSTPDMLNISCRETEVSQVLVNLILNSCDAVSMLDEKWVKVLANEEDGNVKISIIDSGNGIPESIANQIMKPFFTTKEPGKGTGLGLSISQKIIEKHGGKLLVDLDSPNTKFDIILPRI